MNTGRLNLASIAPCLLAIIVDSLGFGLVYPVMTVLFTDIHSGMLPASASLALHHFYLGLGYLLYPLCMFFGASTMGDLSDQWGRKKIILICIGGLALGFALMGLGVEVKSILILMIGRALSGLMAGSQPIVQAAISDLSTPETKILNMSLLTLAGTVGIVLGPLLGGIASDTQLVSWFNFSTPFWVAMILSIISFIWLNMSFVDTHVPAEKEPYRFFRVFTLFVTAFKNNKLTWLVIIFLLMQIGFGIYFQFSLVLLNNEYQYSNALLGIFNAFIGVGFAVGMTVIIRLMLMVINVRQIAWLGFLIAAICQIATGLTHSITWIWIFAFILGAFDMAAFTAMLTNFSDAVSSKQQGLAMGLSGSTMAIAWAITGLGSNLLTLMGVRNLIILGGFCLFVSFILMTIFMKQYKD